MSQSTSIIILVAFIAVVVILTQLLSKKLHPIKPQDADIPNQVNKIAEYITTSLDGSTDFHTVPIVTVQTTSDMLKDSLKGGALSLVTGHKVHICSDVSEKYILIWENKKLYFVPFLVEGKTMEIKAVPEKVSLLSADDLSKIKTNGKGTSITLTLDNKQRISFKTLNTWFYPKVSAESERNDFSSFILDFSKEINN